MYAIKRFKWLWMFVVVLAVLSLVICISCSKSAAPQEVTEETVTAEETTTTEAPAEKVTLRLFTISADESRILIMNDYIIPNIEAALPNVEVQFEEGGGGEDYNNKLKTYNSTGDLPDVWYSDASFASAIINAGNMLDLNPYVTEDGFLAKVSIPEALQYKDGEIYVLNSGVDAFFTPRIFYNKAIFDECGVTIPETFDELIDVCKTISAKGYVPVSTVGKGGWAPQLYLVQTMITIEDPQVMLDLLADKTDFTNPVVKNGLGRIETLAKEGAFPEGIALLDYGPAKEMFTSGKSAMYWMFSWELPSLNTDPNIGPDVDFFLWPSAGDAYDPNEAIQYWGSPLNGYAVNSKSEHIEEAVKLAEFCAMQDALFFQSTGAPIILDTGVETTGQSDLMKKNVEQFLNCDTKIASILLNGMDAATSSEFATLGASLLTGEFTADEFVDQFKPVWEKNTYFD